MLLRMKIHKGIRLFTQEAKKKTGRKKEPSLLGKLLFRVSGKLCRWSKMLHCIYYKKT